MVCFPRAQGSVFYRLLVESAVVLVLLAQGIRGRELALSMTGAIGEEKVRERYPQHEADENCAACSKGNKASQRSTQRNECQTRDYSEMFHDIYHLSREDTC